MIRELVRLRDRNQITLPSEIAERLSAESGSLLELVMDPNGDYVELHRAEVVRAGTQQAEREEQWAREDIKAGRFSTFANPEDLLRDAQKARAAAKLQEQVEALQQQVQGLVLDVRKMRESSGLPAAAAGLETSSKVG